ncbi:MAG TPA: hypothetical protein VFE63_14420 [Roseiarcus sp.]|jgi:hypothetical protein|nr:hypothetical protein [Roseiarcus sp.]
MSSSLSKYQPLTMLLRGQRGARAPMTFAEIERVIGAKLPPSASKYRAWWSNNPLNNVMTKAWLDAGFESEDVDLKGRKVVFRRVDSGAGSPKSAATSSGGVSHGKLALFGWLVGTVVVTGDLTEPADPEWSERIDNEYPPTA